MKKRDCITTINGTPVYREYEHQEEHPASVEGQEPLNLIEQLEQQTGQRWDSNGGDNRTTDSLFGAMARALGKNPHRPEDDAVVGALIRHEMSPVGQAQKEADTALVKLLTMGVGPDEINLLTGS